MEASNKLLLVQPPSRARTQRPPLGLMYISSYLSKEAIGNEIIDIKSKAACDTILEMILDKVKGTAADIIGITCLVTEIEIVGDMCRRIKAIRPDSIIVLGGAQPTSHPEQFSDWRAHIDYFVIGEGEITFAELVKAIRKSPSARGEIEKVDGIAWFDGDRVKKSRPRELIQDLDSLPLPAYDKIDMEYYTRPTVWASRPILLSFFWIFSSRGCPFHCRYCVAHEIFGRRVRFRSTRSVLDEIRYLIDRHKIDGIYFYDESFTVNSARTIEMCNAIIEETPDIIFGCQTRANLISEKVIEKMAQAGWLQIDFGIESGSDRILKLIQKDITVEQVISAIGICKKYGIRSFANMMVNLPDETSGELKASIDLMKKLDCNVVIWNVTVPYPGGFLDKKLAKEDYKKLMGFPSNEAYELLEAKYKFAKYDIGLKALVDKLYTIFPHPRYFHFKLSPDYIKRCLLYINFIFKPRYLKTVFRSRRKLQYIKSIISQPMHS